MKYQILYIGNTDNLTDLVNAAIAEGWRPQGGVAVIKQPNAGTYDFFQAMVKD